MIFKTMVAGSPAAAFARAARYSARHSYASCATTAASPIRHAERRAVATANPSSWRSPCGMVSSCRHYAGCACSGAKRPTTAYIALGSNMGNRVGEIERACNEMDERGIRVKRTSSLWETEPMYVKDQDRFLNGACEVCEGVLGQYPAQNGE